MTKPQNRSSLQQAQSLDKNSRVQNNNNKQGRSPGERTTRKGWGQQKNSSTDDANSSPKSILARPSPTCTAVNCSNTVHTAVVINCSGNKCDENVHVACGVQYDGILYCVSCATAKHAKMLDSSMESTENDMDKTNTDEDTNESMMNTSADFPPLDEPPLLDRQTSQQKDLTTAPYVTKADPEHYSTNGRIKALGPIFQAVKKQTFRSINDSVTLQALGNLLHEPFNVTQLDMNIKEKLLRKSLQTLDYLITSIPVTGKLIQLVARLAEMSPPATSATPAATRKAFIDKALPTIFSKNKTPNASNLTNAMWQTLCEITGVYVPSECLPSQELQSTLSLLHDKIAKIAKNFEPADDFDYYTITILHRFLQAQKPKAPASPEKGAIAIEKPAGSPKDTGVRFNNEVGTKEYTAAIEKIINRYDVRLTITHLATPQRPTSHVWAIIKAVMDAIHEIDPSLEVLPWAEAGDQTPLEMGLEVESIETLNRYFPRIKAIQSGNAWSEVRMSHTVKWEDIKAHLIPWLIQTKNGIYVKALQVENTRVAGWLLYSHRSLNAVTLADAFFSKHGIRVAFRYQNIATGSQRMPTDNTVSALHVITSNEDLDEIKAIMSKIYHATEIQFPFGIRMRFVPWISFRNTKRVQQVMEMRLRQDTFLHTVIHMASWEFHSIDKSRGSIISLRKLILNLKSKQFPDRSLFISIDQAWNNPGVHVFAFMPRMESEARHAITTLYPLLRHLHGEDVEMYFTQAAQRRSEGCLWDPNVHQIVTKDEVIFDTLQDAIDDDEDWFGFQAPNISVNQIVNLTPATATTVSGIRVEKIFYGDEKDSVGTIRTGATGPLPTGDLELDITIGNRPVATQDSGSIISSSTLDTRVSVMEANIERLVQSITNMSSVLTNVQQAVLQNNNDNRQGNSHPDSDSPVGPTNEGADPTK